MNLLSPFTSPESWDTILIGGLQSPGRVEVIASPRKSGWDIKKGKGTRFATLTYVEAPPVEGELEFTLWLDEHFAQWANFAPVFFYDPTKQPDASNAVDVYHPRLAFLGVNACVFGEIDGPFMQPDFSWLIKVKFIEYAKVPNASAVSTANGSAANAQNPGAQQPVGGQPNSAPDAQDQEIAAKQAQIGQLNNQLASE
jgi:hypothetical protein